MKKLFSLIISAVLVLGAASAVFAAEEPNPALLEPEMSLVITQDCIGYQDGKALEEVYVLSGSEVTFRVGDNVPESSDVQWLAQFPTGTAFTDYQRIEGGRAITMKVPSDLLVAAFAEGIPPYEGTPAEEPAPVEEEVPAGDLPFTDVKNSDWFHDAVKEMYEKGYMGGVSDNKYEPQSEGKRSEIVTVLYRIDGSPKMSGDLKFSDITKGTELADAAIWASECGIASGYPDGTFKPDQSVSRQELAQFVYKYVQYRGAGFVGAWYFPLDFKDTDQIGSWADEAVHWCVMNEVISGMGDGTIAPKGTTTRAQLASLFNRFRKLDLPLAGDPPVDEQLFGDMPLGTYESQEMARQVTIFAEGRYEMLGGHGAASTKPFSGFWESGPVHLDEEMVADGVYFYDTEEDLENGNASMYWIWDGDQFIIGPWEGEDALYEHMVRTQKPIIPIEGAWVVLSWEGTGIERFVFSKGSWEARNVNGTVLDAGTYKAQDGEENTYKMFDASGKTYDLVNTCFNDYGTCLYFQSTGDFLITESAVKG